MTPFISSRVRKLDVGIPGYTDTSSVVDVTGKVSIGTKIDIAPYDNINNGTLRLEGSAGTLFSISNNLTTGSIFSVNDVTGVPSLDVNADGTILLAPFGQTEYIGIGKTNPTQKVDIDGSIKLSGNLLFENINVISYSAADVGVDTISFEGSEGQLFSVTNNLSTGSLFSVNNVAGLPYINVDADGTIIAGINAAVGNFGIGTETPTEKLEVVGSIKASDGLILSDTGPYNTVIQYVTPTNNRNISFPDATGTIALVAGTTGQIQYNDNGKLAASPNFVIDSNSNVGIGTSSPSEKLEVNGIIKIKDNTITPKLQIVSTTVGGNVPTYPSIEFRAGGYYTEFVSGKIIVLNSPDPFTTPGEIQLYTTKGGTNNVYQGWKVDGDGYLTQVSGQWLGITEGGIRFSGTGGTQRLIEVKTQDGTSVSGIPLKIKAGNGNASGNASGGNLLLYAGSKYASGSGSDGNILFGTDTAEHARITSDGKLGLGISSPAGALHVDAASGVDGPIFDSGGTANSNHALLVRDSANNQLLRVNNDGKVGIGTASPNTQLEVVGSTPNIRMKPAANTEIAYHSFANTSNSTRGYLAYDFNTESLFLGVNTAERLRIKSDGNVGIGTDDPSEKLEVVGNLIVRSDTSNLLIYNPGTGFSGTMIVNDNFHTALNGKVVGTNGGTGQIVIGGIITANTSGSNFNIGIGYGSSVNGAECIAIGRNAVAAGNRSVAIGYNSNAPDGTTVIASNGSERLRITETGNVFIGTPTSPLVNTNNSKLVVDGTISETVSGIQYPVVSQFDIGTDPNQIPLNQFLGDMAFADFPFAQVANNSNGAAATVVVNAQTTDLYSHIASYSTDVTYQISNLESGHEIKMYLRNTNASARTITIQASTTNSGYANVNLAPGAGTMGAASVSTVTLAATSGTTMIYVANIGGDIVGGILA